MKTCIAVIAAAFSMLGSALAEERYDRTLEAAAIRIAAGKMGEIRGAFSAEDRPQFTAPIDRSLPTHLSARPDKPVPAEAASSRQGSSITTF